MHALKRLSLAALTLAFFASFPAVAHAVEYSARDGDTIPVIENEKSNAETEKDVCEKIGGNYGFHGEYLKPRCIYPAKDAGQECFDSSECEGECIAELTEEQENILVEEFGAHTIETGGRCSKWQAMFGCFPRVENGTVSEILCVD